MIWAIGGPLALDPAIAVPITRVSCLLAQSFLSRDARESSIDGQIDFNGVSTLARLTLGLYEPDDGSVMLDGLNARAVDPADNTRNIGAMRRDCWLFSGTLRENLIAGHLGVTDDEVHRKAVLSLVDHIAGAHLHGCNMLVQ